QTAAPAAPARDDIVNALNKFDTAPELDIPALKQAISERSKVRSKKEPEANKRPPVVPEIMNLPATFNVAIAFDVDTPIILPESYETVGRIADAIRDVLSNTFKISSKRLMSLGVGEEQFIDQAHPTSAVNQQIQIITIGKVPETQAPA